MFGGFAPPLNASVRAVPMRYLKVLVALVFLASMEASAEISKVAVPEDSGFQLYWWPVLPIPAGWLHDEGISRASGVNMLRPRGTTFAKAPAVMYGRADFKPRIPEVHSLIEYVAKDRNALAEESPTTVIAELQAVRNGDGKLLSVVSYVIPSRHQWELTAYGEEGEFYLLFTLSASSEAGFNQARPVFYAMLATYKERP